MLVIWKLVVPKFSVHQNYLESLLKHRLLGFTPSVSDLVGLEWGQRVAFPTSSQVLLLLVLLLLLWIPLWKWPCDNEQVYFSRVRQPTLSLPQRITERT